MTTILKGNIISAPSPGRLDVTENGYLIAENGVITGVYPVLPELYAGAAVEDCGDALIVQSFADLHLHAPQYPMLGMGMDLPLLDWLNAYAFPTEARFADPDYARTVYRQLAQELAAHGTTRVCMFSSLHTDATLILMAELERAGITGYVGKVNMDRNAAPGVLDSSDAQNNVDRANISVSQAQLAYQQAKEGLNPTATISGTINELYVHNGDSVTAGSPIAKIVSSMDLSVDFLFPYAKSTDFYVGQPATVYAGNFDAPVSGTVESVSNSTSVTSNGLTAITVRVKIHNPGSLTDSMTATAQIGSYGSYGQTPLTLGGSSTVYATASGTVQGLTKLAGSTVKQGETLCTVESETVRDQIQNASLNLKNAQLAASMAADGLDDYKITSQITGRVIEKNFKTGDKVEGMNSGSLAVIYDMSYLKLEMAVDELDIGKVAVGQEVEITADALEGQTFSGVVDKISINGTTAGGATSYPVTIIIENYGDLKPGMNVSATIKGDQVPNALCIPVDAVNRGNTVLVPGPGAMNEDNTAVIDASKLESRDVTLGKNDGDYIEVTSGLEEGDIVLIANQSSNMMDMMMGM